MTSSAVLAIWVDIDPEDDEAFNHWHSREHVQERVGLPGWLRGSRFRGIERPQRYLLFYDADAVAAFDSAAYYARLGDRRHSAARSFRSSTIPGAPSARSNGGWARASALRC